MVKSKTVARKPKINKKKIPKHIGIIMDGNRRWAAKKGLTADQGHEAGVKALVAIVEHCLDLGVETLTIYALSTENWRKRARKEVQGIFNLLVKAVEEKKEEYKKKGVKLAIIGNFQAFPRKVIKAIEEMLSIVKTHERLKVNVALNYGGRDEILRAVKKIADEKIPPQKINEKMFGQLLYTNGEPDPDLIIRTGGEVRLSNFLLWQSTYSELYFTDTLWPDFSPAKLDKAIAEYQKRTRSLGGGKFEFYQKK
ncbi:MAG: polyprenyl diphosphate synthase [Candidatus Marinimicrobia bacterium]|nr:polyprenyl diphosphate synthase [Candidatus Neomarinimicrobiota bacterium]